MSRSANTSSTIDTRATPGASDEEVEARVALGTTLATEGRREEGIKLFREALLLCPGHGKAHHNLGVALAEQKKFTEALPCFREALRCHPSYAEAYHSLGNTLGELSRDEDAIAAYRDALRLRPDFVDALHNLGVTLTRRGRAAEGVVFLQQALRLRPNFPDGHNSLGLAHMDRGDIAAAVTCYQEALRLNPRHADAHTNLGSAFKEQGCLDEAVACYELALGLDPDSVTTHWNRALAWLQMGNFEQGWPEYEWRCRRKGTVPYTFPQPRWDGSPLQGRTILLHAEQGLGDALQFVRYAPLVKQRGGTVLLFVPPPLVALLSTCPGVDQVVPEGKEPPATDVHAPLMSLPGIFRTTLATVPAEVPYLAAEPSKLENWRERLRTAPGFKVGIVWQGNPRHKWDRHRSFALAMMEPLARVENVNLISIQKGAGLEQIAFLGHHFPVVDLGPDLAEFTDTAAVMKCLDLVVCCDTSVAHLAGALGVPVWVALSLIVDWRWLLGREHSPWYPTMRLFRQERLGEWRPVFQRMAEELTTHLKKLHAGVGRKPDPQPPGMVSPATVLKSAINCYQKNDLAGAERLYRQVLRADPYNPEVLYGLGSVCQVQNRMKEALEYLVQTLRFRPNYAEARHALAQNYAAKGDLEAAIEEFRLVLRSQPDSPEVLHNLGVTLARLKKLDEAIAAFRQAIQCKPAYTVAILNLARAFEENGNNEKAMSAYQDLLRLRPDDAVTHNTLGLLLAKCRRQAEAVEAFQKALTVDPKQAAFHNNLGVALVELGRPVEAQRYFDAALRLNPNHAEAHKSLGMTSLSLGDFETGWREFEWRWKCQGFAVRQFRQPAWDGTSPEGQRILLYTEQGIGDTFQFIRYAARLAERGALVTIECASPLVQLLRTCPGITQVVPQGEPLPEFDCHAPLMSLPRLLGTTLATVPADVPYLSADPILVKRWQQELPLTRSYKVGIVWQGNPTNGYDYRRSVHLDHFEVFAAVPGVQLFNLQFGQEREQLAKVKDQFPVIDLGELLDVRDFQMTAAAICNLDLVVSCDTANAHLAGALGRPVWVCLSYAADWRWLLDRADSPWYPTMRLFRQERLGEWTPVFQRMAGELARLVG